MLMTDEMIQKAVETGDLTIENFDPAGLQPASYDMRLGEEAITSSGREKIDPSRRGLCIIPAGDFALVTTHEKVKLTTRVAGHIGLRSHYTRRGLVLLSGPQVDPGYEGVLVIGLANLAPHDVTIPHKERFCTVEFYALAEPAKEPYKGEYQGQRSISGRDLEALVQAPGMTFGQVIETLGKLSRDVQALKAAVDSMRWTVGIGIGVIGVLVGIMAIIVAIR